MGTCTGINGRFYWTASDIIDIHVLLGVKQGDPSSSLLFMLFVNDILDNINSNLDGIFTMNEIKLF